MSVRYSPNGWFSYNPQANQWTPTVNNRFPDWKNFVVTDVFRPDERGKSRWVSISDLQARYPDLSGQFGGNGSNFFTRNSPILDFALEAELNGNKVVRRRLAGLAYKPVNSTARTIRPDILRQIRSQPCALTGSTSNIECDHRCSRRPPNTQPQLQHVEDFQPLSKAANCRKRQACNECMQTGERFDATPLGFSVGWTNGNLHTQSCEGCFWFDPREFRKAFVLKSDPNPVDLNSPDHDQPQPRRP